jgi:hypothetical protein
MIAFDLLPHLAAISASNLPADARCGRSPLSVASALNNGNLLGVFTTEPALIARLPGITLIDDPEAANVSLVVHRGDARATAAKVEERMLMGQRIALWDASGDPALLEALLDSIVYVGNLAALDTDLERTLAAVMTPLREGAAFRRYLAHSALTQWVWDGIVREEVERRFGQAIDPRDLPRALDQTRSRLGAWLVRLGKRGLRYQIQRFGFRHNRLDAFWLELEPA